MADIFTKEIRDVAHFRELAFVLIIPKVLGRRQPYATAYDVEICRMYHKDWVCVVRIGFASLRLCLVFGSFRLVSKNNQYSM